MIPVLATLAFSQMIAPAEEPWLRGKVKDELGRPVVEAHVQVRELRSSFVWLRLSSPGDRAYMISEEDVVRVTETRTNARGEFEIAASTNDVLLKVRTATRASRWLWTHRESTPAEPIDIRVHLARALPVRIVSATGTPVAGATVTYRESAQELWDSATYPEIRFERGGIHVESLGMPGVIRTDRAGRATLEAVPRLPYHLSIDHPDHLFLWRPLAPDTDSIDTSFPLHGRVEGRLLDAADEPVVGAKVIVTGYFPGYRTPVTDEDGRFDVTDVPQSLNVDLWVWLSDGAYGGAYSNLAIENGRFTKLTLRRPPMTALRGVVVDRSGRPVADREVEVRGPILDMWSDPNLRLDRRGSTIHAVNDLSSPWLVGKTRVRTGDAGEFRFSLPAGTYCLGVGDTEVDATAGGAQVVIDVAADDRG